MRELCDFAQENRCASEGAEMKDVPAVSLSWSDVDMNDELHAMKILLSAVLYMDITSADERDAGEAIINKLLKRVTDLKNACEQEAYHA